MGDKVSEHIHPVFDRILQRGSKEKLLNQIGKVVWMTGLSALSESYCCYSRRTGSKQKRVSHSDIGW